MLFCKNRGLCKTASQKEMDLAQATAEKNSIKDRRSVSNHRLCGCRTSGSGSLWHGTEKKEKRKRRIISLFPYINKRIFQSVKEIFMDEESFFVYLDHHFLPCYSKKENMF